MGNFIHKYGLGIIMIIVLIIMLLWVGLAISEFASGKANSNELAIGRYAIAGALLSDGYSSTFVIIDTMTGDYQAINIGFWGSDRKLRVRSRCSGKVE